MQQEMKPCPFCKSDWTYVTGTKRDDGKINHFAGCANCGAKGPTTSLNSEVAQSAWNCRSERMDAAKGSEERMIKFGEALGELSLEKLKECMEQSKKVGDYVNADIPLVLIEELRQRDEKIKRQLCDLCAADIREEKGT